MLRNHLGWTWRRLVAFCFLFLASPSLLLTVVLGPASRAAALPPSVPWALSGTSAQTLAAATAVVGIEPQTRNGRNPWVPFSFDGPFGLATVGFDGPQWQGFNPFGRGQTPAWGPPVGFSLTDGDSFTTVPYYGGSAGTAALTAAEIAANRTYATSATSVNVAHDYPFSVDNNSPYVGQSTQPHAAAPYNVTEVGLKVGSAVTAVSSSAGTIYTDPSWYTQGRKLSLTNSNDPTFAPGAAAAIIAGTYVSSGVPLQMQWRTRTQNEMDKGTGGGSNDLGPTRGPGSNGTADYLASEVMQLQGQADGADFVLEMDYSNVIETPGDQMSDLMANRDLYLGKLAGTGTGHGFGAGSNTVWENAVYDNVATTFTVKSGKNGKDVEETLPAVGAYAWQPGDSSTSYVAATSPSNQPYIGSFQSFLNSTYYQGGQTHYFYEHSLDQLRGSWGIDTSTDTAWAVLDVGNGMFAVVPEPASLHLVAGGMVCLAVGFWWRRRGRIKGAKAAKAAGGAKGKFRNELFVLLW